MAATETDKTELLDKVPVHHLEWKPGPDERVVLLVPKFRQRHLARWILPLLAKPAIRVHLDQIGSAVWRMCDGSRTVREICRELAEKREGDPSDWSERVVRFLRQLERERFIRLD